MIAGVRERFIALLADDAKFAPQPSRSAFRGQSELTAVPSSR